MFQLKIRDISPRGCLAFDLKNILDALGPEALGWSWTVSDVEENGEELWTLGEGTSELEALKKSGTVISGTHLADVAQRITQVIWGEFKAFRHDPGDPPLVRIVAFDSSWFEVWSEDRSILISVCAAFKDTAFNIV